MRNKNSFKKFILDREDNKGSIMVTVLVAFLFVAILAAIILSTVTVNFQMRAIDRRTKDEFYYAEKALNDLYNGLGQECSAIMGRAYNDVLAAYKTTDGDKTSYKDEEKAYKAFSEEFVKAFYTNIASNQSSKFSGYIVKDTHKKGDIDTKESRAIVKNYGNIKYYSSEARDSALEVSSASDDDIKNVKIIVVEGVKIQSNPDANENIGYVSEINTDIVIEVPKISFFTTNNRVFDYAILANDGLELEENATVDVKGNLYGGTIPFKNISNNVKSGTNYTRTAEYGGITLNKNSELKVSDAAYVVSGGDITVDDAAKLYINQENSMLNNQIWFENIEINGEAAEVDIKGDLFAADDLQVNSSAKGSKVKIQGSYYGYNDGEREMTGTNGNNGDTTTLTTKKAIITSSSDYEKSGDAGINAASRSSSIVINAKEADIDMSELKTLLLCGNAYVNHESKKSIVPGSGMGMGPIDLIVDAGKIENASVPESVALKMSQDIILVPTEFLKDTNPRICESGPEDPFLADSITIPNDWFGKSYIDSSKPYTYVKLSADNKAMVYAYCYLNFKDEKSKSQYVKAIIDGTDSGAEPTAATIKSELLERIKSYEGKLSVKVGNGNTRTYANGAVLTYDDVSGLDVINPADYVDSKVFTKYSANLYKRYRMLDTFLDNMADIPLSATDNKSINYSDFQRKDDEMPTGRFFWLWGLRKAGGDTQRIMASDSEEELKEFGSNFVFIRNTSAEGVNLNAELSSSNPHKAFVIIDGNATVNSDLTIYGFLVCKGKLTVKNGKKLTVVYDSTLLNKRIEQEQKVLVKNEGFHDDKTPNNNAEVRNLLIYYLMNGSRNLYGSGSEYKMPVTVDNINNSVMNSHPEYREYSYIDGATENNSDDINTEYTNFVYFENWKKGQQ